MAVPDEELNIAIFAEASELLATRQHLDHLVKKTGSKSGMTRKKCLVAQSAQSDQMQRNVNDGVPSRVRGREE